jgi:hypothetical protein
MMVNIQNQFVAQTADLAEEVIYSAILSTTRSSFLQEFSQGFFLIAAC